MHPGGAAQATQCGAEALLGAVVQWHLMRCSGTYWVQAGGAERWSRILFTAAEQRKQRQFFPASLSPDSAAGIHKDEKLAGTFCLH